MQLKNCVSRCSFRFQTYLSVIRFSLLCLLLATGSVFAVTVDLMVAYDRHSENYFNSDPQTAMYSWVSQVNNAYRASQIDIQLRLVAVVENDIGGDTMDNVLGQITNDNRLKSLRDRYGADFVTQLHRTGSCGIGWMSVHRDWAWNVVGPQCGAMVLAHELGHNMGLAHSRRQGDTGGIRYPYALGHGEDYQFGTIMTYAWLYNASRTDVFSNPDISCGHSPCGVRAGLRDQADVRLALNNVRYELANFREEKVSASFSSDARVTHTGYCIDVDDWSLENGANILQWPCHAGNNQNWIFDPVAGRPDVYTIRSRHSNKCLDVRGGGQANGENVIQWECHGGAMQQWHLRPAFGFGVNHYQLVAQHSGKCLDVSGVSYQEGANIFQWDCHDAGLAQQLRNQVWFLPAKP